MKKLISCLLVLAMMLTMAVALTGCGNKTQNDGSLQYGDLAAKMVHIWNSIISIRNFGQKTVMFPLNLSAAISR